MAETEQAARDIVRELQDAGADFIKVYNGLPEKLYKAVLDEANTRKIPVYGHVSYFVSAAVAAEAGQRTIEHLTGVVAGCSTEGESVRQLTLDMFESGVLTQNPPPKDAAITLFTARKRLFSTLDPKRAEALFQTFLKNGTWQCPTLVSNRAVSLAGLDAAFENDSRSEYLPASLTNSWAPDRRMKLYSEDERRERYALQKSIVGKMYRFGVPIIAGTDAGANYVYAGFSLHDELEQLVEAGLSPLAALQSVTRNPAELLGMLDSLGTVEVGKLADLVLLDANPCTILQTHAR